MAEAVAALVVVAVFLVVAASREQCDVGLKSILGEGLGVRLGGLWGAVLSGAFLRRHSW